MTPGDTHRQRVAIVTGGGAGIGAAIAEELGRTGTYVVTMDPLVTVDGTEQIPSTEETTADRIIAAGGSSRASSVSVTDADGVRSLFAEVAEEFDGLDAVINVAGITRPTSFSRGSEDDWRSVLSVHLDGYRNVLGAALPIMAAAGRGHIVGVTSGSGWRPADTGAYGCAKRAVASLTWQIGRQAPPGVVVNAISPIAMTRMVTAALGRRKPESHTASGVPTKSSTGGLSLASMPTPEQLGPLAVHLVGHDFDSCRGQVLFAAGSEMAVIEGPRMLEVVDVGGAASTAHVLHAVTAGALLSAEDAQESKGGTNPRFGVGLDAVDAVDLVAPAIRRCLVVSDRDDLADEVATALEARGVTCTRVGVERSADFAAATESLALAVDADGPIDGVVVALSGDDAAPPEPGAWEQTLNEHTQIVDQIHTDAAWARAVADLSDRTQDPIRLATLTDAASAGGRSRAQASAQLARSAFGATDGRVAAFAVAVETGNGSTIKASGALVAHLLCSAESPPLSGAELVVSGETIGLRSHPRVGASVILADSGIPDWFDDALEGMVR